MAELFRTAATLRFFGDDLDPDEVSSALGAAPTVGVRRGGVWLTSGGVAKVARTGSWRLEVPDQRAPGDLDIQVAALFALLTTDMRVWNVLTVKHDADIFCGLFLKKGNEGLSLSPRTLADIGNRGLKLDLDIYDSATG